MKRRDRIELLSPAGTFEALIAAVRAGADAVYVGGKSFGARAYATNFDRDELRSAVEYCHLHGVKIYVTVNTLVYDRELGDLIDYAAYLYSVGVDAIICADLGAIREIRRCVPDLEIHASTQMSVHNAAGARIAYSLGCKRVVPARELSLEDINEIVESTPCEVEIFLHGALCVCYSGQCLFSSLVGGRSGNRGECAQPCRLPYNGGRYPLSLKDLALAAHIPAILASGVSSLKIEGRMKSADYVYRVTSIYRRLIDEGRAARADELRELADIFSRGGFTDGYFTKNTEKNMTGVRSERDKEITRGVARTSFSPDRVRVTAEAVIRLGQPSSMTLIRGDRRVTAYGAVPAVAENAPLTEDSVRDRLSRMGNTYLSLSPSDLSLTLDPGVNLAPSMLNALRRDAAAMMQGAGRNFALDATPCDTKIQKREYKKLKTALFFERNALAGALDAEPRLCSYFDITFLPLWQYESLGGRVEGVYIPPTIFDSELADVRAMLTSAVREGARYALVGNLGAIDLVREVGLIPIGDFRFNISNRAAREALYDLGIEAVILSPELTPPMARDVGGSVISYGRIPLMLTERCFMRESFGCEKCGKCALKDRTGAAFPMMREYPHRNIIFNSAPTYMADKRQEMVKNSLYSEHYIFSVETSTQIPEILKRIKCGAPAPHPVRRMGRRDPK